MKKQKVKMTATSQMELLPLFNHVIQEVAGLAAKISVLQGQLDDVVFSIYGIDTADAKRIRSEMKIEI